MHRASSPATCRAAGCSAVLLVAILLGLAFAPFLFPGTRSLNVAAKVCVFILLVASLRPAARLHRHRLVRAHHVLRHRRLRHRHRHVASWAPSWGSLALGIARRAGAVARAVAGRSACSRCGCETIFFAMITLAVASFFADPRLAALGPHRRRGRHHLPAAGAAPPGTQLLEPILGVTSTAGS